MARRFVFAAVVAASVGGIASVSPDDSCAEDAILSRIELDESSMLQQPISAVHFQASTEGSSEQVISASNVLSKARSLVDAVKNKNDDDGNIKGAVADYASIVESEVIPNIEAAMAEIDDLLVIQRQFVHQCDVRLQASETKRIDLLHNFLEKRSLHEACARGESGLAEQVAKCLDQTDTHEDCAQLESYHAAKLAECYNAGAEVDEGACAQASHAHGVCAAYTDCRLNSMAVYESAASTATNRARSYRAQLAEAKQAQCIARGLVALLASSVKVESMMAQLEEGCDDLIPDVKDEARLEFNNVHMMPPAIACQDAVIQPCSDDRVEIHLGSAVTWSVPCNLCPAMVKATATTSTPSSWLSSFGSFASSAKEVAEAYIDPRQRSAMTISLIGVNAKTTLISREQTASTGQYVVILIAVPLVALGIALGVAVAVAPGRQNNYTSDSTSSPKMPGGRRGSNAMGQRGLKEAPSPRLADPRLSTRHSFSSTHDRPSMVGGHLHNHPYGQDRPSVGLPRHSLPPSMTPPVVESFHSAVPEGLCPELIVPEGSECILGVPTLSGAPRGEVLLKNITDKSGESLLYVGLTAAPAGGEYVLLAKKDQQELAFCELGNAVRSEGWSGKIFRWDGELYARIREENASEVGRRSPGIPGINRTFVVLSAAGAPWELRVTGNFRDRKICIEDGARQVVAMVSPGEELAFSQPAGEFYKLRLGPSADSCTIIVALMAMERLMCP